MIRSGFGLNYDPYPLAFVRNMLTNYPNDLLLTINQTSTQTAATQLKAGIPAINVPDITSGLVTVPAAYAVRSLPQNTVRGYIMSWNLSVQKQLPGALIAQASYVGSRQIKIVQRFDLNAGQIPGAGVAGQPYFAKYGRTTATELLTPIGRNNYDSCKLLCSAHGARSDGEPAYTWSKVIGICCDDLSDGYPRVLALQYMALNRAIMPYDRTHNFTTSFVAELPFGKGKKWASSGAAAKLLGGWQVNGLLASYSGLPFSVSAAGTSLNLPQSTQRANQVKSSVAILGGAGPNHSYFDPLAFAPVTTPAFGNAGYDSLRGPGSFNIDSGVFREFAVTERWKVQFRAEALNVTNTPHFSNPNGKVSRLYCRGWLGPQPGGYTVINSTHRRGARLMKRCSPRLASCSEVWSGSTAGDGSQRATRTTDLGRPISAYTVGQAKSTDPARHIAAFRPGRRSADPDLGAGSRRAHGAGFYARSDETDRGSRESPHTLG